MSNDNEPIELFPGPERALVVGDAPERLTAATLQALTK